MLFEKLTGGTPLIRLPCPNIRLLAKAEWRNASGSVKDRTALSMIRSAQKQGLLRPGGTVIEATSGNTGIALAALAAAEKYGCTIVMPENASRERLQLLRSYGAEVKLTAAAEGMAGAKALAQELAENDPRSYYADQFSNPANPQAHYASTGPEIWKETGGKVDIFLAGVGTGGTLTGTGRYLKERNPALQIVAVFPAPGQLIPGLGAGFVPAVLDQALVDERIEVFAKDAAAAAKDLARTTGILPGISSGAALYAAGLLALRPENLGKTLVTIFPDAGERYLSTGVF